MRGEETQILGALDSPARRDRAVLLPGTHSKWVEVAAGRIAALRDLHDRRGVRRAAQHTILGRLMADGAATIRAFAAGLARARAPGGLLHHLFAVRTEGLFGRLAPRGARPVPLRAADRPRGGSARARLRRAGAVTIVGGAALTRRYAAALPAASRILAGEDAASRGLWRHRAAKRG